jgi:D-alanyl-D-alanine carboxypeptidase
MHRPAQPLSLALVALLMFALVPALAAAEVALPGTPAGRLAAAWLAAYNTGDEGAMRAFITGNVSAGDLAARPMETRLANFRRMVGELGTLTPVGILDDDPDRLTVHARAAKNEDALAVTFEAKQGTPQFLAGVRIEAGGPGEPPRAAREDTGPPLDEAALVDSIDALLASPGEGGAFSGVAHLVAGDRVVYSRAFGQADRTAGIANTTATRFNIGSINKVFTAVAIGQLVAAGKIALDDPLAKHLPDYPQDDVTRRITIQQLVEHSAGLGDIFGPRYDAIDKRTLRTLADFVPLFRDRPLLFTPGSERRYSNAGYVVLGLVIERVSGQAYDDYVAQNVFAPLGMKDSGPSVVGRNGPGVAVGYTARGGEPRENTANLPGHSSSAGGGLSSAADLVRFARGLKAGRILPAEYIPWVTGGPPPRAGGAGAEAGKGGAAGLAGGAPGLNAALHLWLDADLTLVVMANQDPPAAERRARAIAGWVRRTRLPAS